MLEQRGDEPAATRARRFRPVSAAALPPGGRLPHIRQGTRRPPRRFWTRHRPLWPSEKVLPMSRHAMQRLSFFLLMGVTLYASLGMG